MNSLQELLSFKYSLTPAGRISKVDMYMGMAVLASHRGTCNRGSAGVIVVKDGRPISMGYTGSPAGTPHCFDSGCIVEEGTGCLRTQHGEANAISWAAREGISLKGSVMFTTMSPCLSCAKMIAQAGIIQVIYLEAYRDKSPVDFLRACGVKVIEYASITQFTHISC